MESAATRQTKQISNSVAVKCNIKCINRNVLRNMNMLTFDWPHQCYPIPHPWCCIKMSVANTTIE